MKLGHLLRVLVVRAPASQSADQEDRHGDGRDAKHRTGPGPPEDVAGKVLATAGETCQADINSSMGLLLILTV